jgi:selenide,water dikinase
MAQLNDKAAGAMAESRVHACTDITGFGLIGHASEMARGSGVSIRFLYSSIPILEGTREYAAQGLVPGGAYCNQKFWESETSISRKVPELEKIILFDPQTSGGLLIALPESEGEKLLKKMEERDISKAALIGRVVPREKNLITVE